MKASIRSELVENRRGSFLINHRVIELDVVPIRSLLSSMLIYSAHYDFARSGVVYEGYHPDFPSVNPVNAAPEYIPVLRDDGVLEFMNPNDTDPIPESWQVLSSQHWCIDSGTGWSLR